MEMISFTVKDHAGVPHLYETYLFRGPEGRDIHRQIMGVLAEPVAVAVYELMRTANSDLAARALKESTLEGVSDSVLLMDGLDAGRIGAAARAALTAFPSDLITSILSKTHRDKAPLSVPSVMDAAYCANYGELDIALYEVVKANRFLPLLDIFSASNEAT